MYSSDFKSCLLLLEKHRAHTRMVIISFDECSDIVRSRTQAFDFKLLVLVLQSFDRPAWYGNI